VQGDLTSDLRSDVGAETRAKMVYEYLLQFTDDTYVQETLRFLMTREVAHFQMFEAALESIQPNFPPGILQSDPRYSNLYFNMSNGNDYRGPWNEGKTTRMGETYQYIEDPIRHVMETNSLIDQQIQGSTRTQDEVERMNKELAEMRSKQINESSPKGEQQWNEPMRGGSVSGATGTTMSSTQNKTSERSETTSGRNK